jgi:diguanylate cyclase (GGDEF)-like protein
MGSVRLSFSNLTKSRVTIAAAFFVLLVCLLLAAITAWGAWNARKVELKELETATQNMSQSIAQHADDTFKSADTALVGLVERISNDGTSPKALDRLHKFLMLRVSELPELKGLLIYDKDGNWLVNSQEIINTVGNNADREYFIYHRNHTDMGPHIGPVILSRTTGAWVIPLSRRLNDVNGQFAGVVLATIALDYFNTFYASYDIGHDGVILLVKNDGRQLVHWPLLADSIGADLSKGPLLTLHASHNESGNAMLISPVDGLERLNGYNHVQHYPLVSMVALSKSEILATWREETLLHGAIAVGIICVLGFLGLRLIEQINLRAQAEEEARHTGNALFELNQTLERLALQDGLTGLANRRQFDTALQNELSRATRAASSLALIMIDVDCFKKYNDIYGHLAGDECLRQVGKVIQSAEGRSGDLAARYGGEEFVVLLPNTDVQGALKVAEKIRNAIRQLEIRHDGNLPGVVTISAGVNVLMPVTGNDTPSLLIGSADEALYLAKSAGRNQTRIYRGAALTLIAGAPDQTEISPIPL